MGVHNSRQAHPASREFFNDLHVGEKVKAQAAIGFRNGCAENAEFFEFVDQGDRVRVVFFEVMSDGDNLAIDEMSNFGNYYLSIGIKRHSYGRVLLAEAQ